MTTMTRQPRLNTGIPCQPAPGVESRVTGAAKTRPSIVKPVALDYANVLRIRNGRGTRICVASGVLWVTEENSLEDHVLLPGDAIELARNGTAIVLAHRPSRIVIEVPPGVAPPRVAEMALADGERGRRIALAGTTPLSLPAIASGIATVIRNVLASIRTPVITLSSRWGAADVSTAKGLRANGAFRRLSTTAPAAARDTRHA